MRTIAKAATALTIIGSGLLAAAPAQAAPVSTVPAPASQYGQHVAACARTMGFDGAHNPGLHRGKSGWDPSHTCPMM